MVWFVTVAHRTPRFTGAPVDGHARPYLYVDAAERLHIAKRNMSMHTGSFTRAMPDAKGNEGTPIRFTDPPPFAKANASVINFTSEFDISPTEFP
jgi:hypothetical protein